MATKSSFTENGLFKFFGKTIQRKLVALLIAVGLLPMLAVAISMYQSTSDGLFNKSFAQLEAIKTIKANQVSDYFGFIDKQIRTFSEDIAVVDAMKAFPGAEKTARTEVGATDDDLAKMEQHLRGYYTDKFGAEYGSRNDGAAPPTDEQFQPLDKDSIYLQYQYISANPNPLGSKEVLDAAEDGTAYGKLHAKFHPMVRSYLQKFGYYDIFLCDLESGDIVYSVFKELDFTTSLKDGPYAETNFGRAFQLAAEAKSAEEVFLVDYEEYVPSYNDAASFISSPIYDGDKKIGVAIFQMPIDKIAAIMGERTGMGESGETYAVGTDMLLRNDSRFTPDTMMNPEYVINTKAVQEAFKGNSGLEVIDDYRGVPVLSAWSPVTIYDGIPGRAEPITWALMSEIDDAEVREPLGFMTVAQTGLVWIIGAILGGGLLIWFVARGITQQAASIKEMLGNVGIGLLDARAEKITNDELGDVAEALNAMSETTLSLIESDEKRQGVQQSIEELIGEMEQIAGGNLAVNADVKEDITGTIAGTVNHMTEQLRMIVQQVQNATYMVTSSADEIADQSTQLSQDNEQQAQDIETTSAEVLQITGQFQNVARKTEESVQVAQQARESANRGYKAVTDTVDGMDRIREQVQTTSKRIKRLGESSQEVGEIVQLISDIADRTSILALNASIQASMAGDAGQGFAVVAEEVERLAERSTDATKQISTLIKAIQTGTSEAISDMEEATREVVEGSQLATQAGQTLAEINEVSQQLETSIKQVSDSALEQAAAATRIASTMNNISTTTKQSAEKSRSATEQVTALATLANQLGDSVSRFQLEQGEDQAYTVMNQVNEMSEIASSATRSTANTTLTRLVYTSVRTASCNDAAVEDIVASAQRNNPPLDLTGVLFHTKNRFLQVLEGPHDNVMETYEKIVEDTRHRSALVRFCEPIQQRHFGNWGMGSSFVEQELMHGSEIDRAVYDAVVHGDTDSFGDSGMDVLKDFLNNATQRV
ncbi:methyl-accepting chemotaxis protein [Mariniblastus fucicola]|uniref:Methyl-accepting chemotaxis protein McpB n=1 Tax=Mariniblastus fucicola TaxID=980251 RepID=A0A5B9PEV3_9BACT|nr:methyl-accepting chemotaxis protein [Mariniblastus fucicola]QEG21433.1 Methyl-accepting chemotaxis protein McpB [Mariniblastus fucicola]